MHLRLLRVTSLGVPAIRAAVGHALIQLLVVALRVVVVPAAVVRMPSVAAL